MSFIRPEITATLSARRETIAAAMVGALGLWLLLASSGYVLPVIGLILLVFGLTWGLQANRRQRFAQEGEAPGIVRVTEAQIAYLGPRVGGFVGLPDLMEVRLLTLRGRRIWKLRPVDGDPLHIPVEAQGAEALFDAFATLPGMDTAALVAALSAEGTSDSKVVALNAVDRLIWARTGAGVVVR
jgi:amino acid transporter